MRLLPFLFAVGTASATSSCAIQRSIVAHDYAPLQEPPLQSSWTLTNVSVSAPSDSQLSNHQFTSMLQQIEGHVRQSLAQEPSLGHHQDTSAKTRHAVEVDIKLVEGEGINGYYGVTLGAASLPAAGMLVGVAAAPASLWSLVGVGVGGLVAMGVALATPAVTHSGQLEATVRVRRASDGVEVAQRTVRSEWKAELNAFSKEEKLARAAGDAVPELERAIARATRAAFMSLEALPATNGLAEAAPPDGPTQP